MPVRIKKHREYSFERRVSCGATFWECVLLAVTALFFSEQNLAQSVQSNPFTEGVFFSLAGEHKFHPGDDLSWAAANYDDSDWQMVSVPGLWRDHGVAIRKQVGWYRVKFQLPQNFDSDNPAFVAYFEGQQEEVYLDGEKIGGKEKFAIFGKVPRPILQLGDIRVYPLPLNTSVNTEIEHNNNEHVLALRLNHRMLLEDGGIPHFAFGIVDYHEAALIRASYRQWHWFADSAILAANGLLALIALGLVVMGFRDKLTLSFMAFMWCYFVARIMESLFVTQIASTTALFESLRSCFELLSMIFLLEFSSALMVVPIKRVGRGIQIVLATMIILTVVSPVQHDSIIFIVSLTSLLSIIATVVWVPCAALVALRRRNSMGWVVMLVFIPTVTIPVIIQLIEPTFWQTLTLATGRWPHQIFAQFFILCLVAAAIKRVHDIEQERVSANKRSLEAQQHERQRLARDLHDSMGPMLSSIKLRLQMAQGNQANSQLEPLVQDTQALIQDTRRIAHNLSSTTVEKNGLSRAIHEYLNQLGNDHGVSIEREIEREINIDTGVADHLYRIIQEACHNAIRHGNATQLKITLDKNSSRKDSKNLKATIQDNGIGFDKTKIDDHYSFGLKSMTERVEILGGQIQIDSTVDVGTCIVVNI